MYLNKVTPEIGAMSAEFKRLSPAALKLPNRAQRRHAKAKLKKLRKNLQRYGIVSPLIVDTKLRVLDGCARLQLARELMVTTVPVIVVDGLSEAELKALSLALNKLAEDAEWDWDAVADNLKSIIEIDADFDLQLSGFAVPEIDNIILGAEKRGQVDSIDQDIPAPPARPVAQEGDLFQLGAHRVYCGSNFAPGCNDDLWSTVSAQALFTDAPYNVPVSGHITGHGKIQHREFPMASGEMSREEFIAFLIESLKAQIACLVDGSLIYLFIDWRHIEELQAAARSLGLTPINMCVWIKNNGGLGSLYRSQHELVFVYRKGDTQHRNNVQLGRYGRNRTNVWNYDGVNSFNPSRRAELALHPTTKPVPLVEDALRDCTKRRDVVIDGFLGSGSTLLAAERTGRVCYGAELDRGYCDLIINRWQRLTGKDAVHAASGRTFRDLKARRHRHRPPLPAAA